MVTFNQHLNHYNHNNHVCSNVFHSLNMTVIRHGTLVLRELTVFSNLILNILLHVLFLRKMEQCFIPFQYI